MLAAGNRAYWAAEPYHLPLQETTVGRLLDEVAAGCAQREAVVYLNYPQPGDRLSWSYRELRERCKALAKGLLQQGVAAGERVAVWAPNLPDWLLLEFAAAKVGAILVTVNTASTARELRYVLAQSGACCLFLARGHRHADYLEILAQLAGAPVSSPAGEIAIHGLPRLRFLCLMGEGPPAPLPSVAVLCAWGAGRSDRELEARQRAVSPHDVAQIQYTSGTTGFPKGAQLTHRGIINAAFLWADRLGVNAETRFANPMPFFHTAGCVNGVLGAVSHGATQIPILEFKAEAVLRTVAEERVHFLCSPPTMILAYLEHPLRAELDLGSLRLIHSGGSVIAPELVRRVRQEFGCDFQMSYGLTETSPGVSQTLPADPEEKQATTAGRPMPYTAVKIAAPESGESCAIGEVGEICVQGYNVMRGYFEMPAETAKTLGADGWLRTGDLGVLDDEGYLRVVGRLKDMIIRGGENIYAREIEDFLLTHPKIADVYIVGVPHPRYGEEVAAAIRLRAGERCTAAEIQEFCRHQLAYFKIPKYISFTESFPLTTGGKVRKHELRAALVKQFGLEPPS